jgi:Ca-activated chloride channel family protein
MGFHWPVVLLALLTLPLVMAIYQRLTQRSALEGVAIQTDLMRLEYASRFGTLWRRFLVPGLFLGALALSVVALARPHAPMAVPDDGARVVMVLEASSSMYRNDIEPSRIEAAKNAIKTLLSRMPEGVNTGLVTYAGNATTLVPFTSERQRIVDALETIELGSGYSFLPGLDEALLNFPAATETDHPAKKPSQIVVMYSHGHDRSGRDPMEVAEEFRKRGIVIYTVGVGTHGVNFDDEPLKRVSESTRGQYFPIYSAEDLRLSSDRLNRLLGFKIASSEVTGLVAMLAGLLLGASLLISSLQRRVV